MTFLLVITGVIIAVLSLYAVVTHDSKHGYDCFRPENWEK